MPERKASDGEKTMIATEEFDMVKLTTFLRQNLDSNSADVLVIDGDTVHLLNSIKKAYGYNEFRSYWLNEDGITKNACDYVDVLKEIKCDGLSSEKYDLGKIESLIEQFKMNDIEEKKVNDFEIMLTQSFLHLSKDMLLGADTNSRHLEDWQNKNDSIPEFGILLNQTIKNSDVRQAVQLMRPKHPYYDAFRKEYMRLDSMNSQGSRKISFSLKQEIQNDETNEEIPALRKRLFIEIGIPVDTSSAVWADDLVEGIKKFQSLNHCKITGKIDSSTLTQLNVGFESKLQSLVLNMDRLRWLKHDFPQPYIWVDVPKMELDYVENDSVQFNMRVVVGRLGRPTTMLDARLENIVFSPPWTVPPTIMKEEVVPGIRRRGSSYLSRRGLKAYDRRGRIVNGNIINEKNYKRFTIGQDPGYRSSLGEVKFNLPNPWSIYLHDTPHREDFVKFYRAYSSGCIRVQKPKQFAAFILRDSTAYSYAKIDSICKTRKTVFVPVERNINVHIVYLTNALDSVGNVMYLKDIYKWDRKS